MSPTRYFDNTRLSYMKDCERKFYYRHRRHWRPQGTAIALVFGLAWHEAMEVVWPAINRGEPEDSAFQAGMAAFEKRWVEESLPSFAEWDMEHNDKFSPRTPGVAAEMLYNYILRRGNWIRECEILAVEMPFAVPLEVHDENLFYIGRIDKVVRHRTDGLLGIEHKTTTAYKKDGGFRRDYLESFSPNSQVDGYIHALKMQHGTLAKGVWVDAALVHKQVHDQFKFIPCERIFAMLNAWGFDTTSVIDRIEYEDHRLEEFQSSDEVHSAEFMPAFPKNTEMCDTKYGPCAYKDVCRFIPNPEKLSEPPDGYIEEKWEPFDILNLSQIGLQPEE